MSVILNLVFADSRGNVVIDDGIEALARSGTSLVEIDEADFIPLPDGADLTLLPDRLPVGTDMASGDGEVVTLDEYRGKGVNALAALLPVGYTRTLVPAYEKESEDVNLLPLFGYSAVAAKDGRLYVAAVQTDDLDTWHPSLYNLPNLKDAIDQAMSEVPGNRIMEQLAKCSLEYHCHTAQNIFYKRWEGGIPVSKTCNADCVGCISLQPSECCPSPQGRIGFTPTVEEVVSLGIRHLTGSEDGIISFGQGCEGDPLTQGDLLAKSISGIRRVTPKGTININTNAGMTASLQSVIASGLDTIRISIFSPIPAEYECYHRPKNYKLDDVLDSLDLCKREKVKVSLNLLTLPGFTDGPDRLERLCDLINEYEVDMVQMRNLNIDPDYLGEKLGNYDTVPGLGIRKAIEVIKKETNARIGNFSRPA